MFAQGFEGSLLQMKLMVWLFLRACLALSFFFCPGSIFEANSQRVFFFISSSMLVLGVQRYPLHGPLGCPLHLNLLRGHVSQQPWWTPDVF